MKRGQEFRKSEVGENHLLGDGIFALGVLTGLIIVIVAYLGQRIWGALLTKDQIVEILPAIAAFLVALVSLLISFRALVEQKKMRQAGVDPVVIAHLGQRKDEPSVLTVNLSNVGAGAAMNVSIMVKPPENANDKKLWTNIFSDEIFTGKKQIATILQNTSVTYSLGMGFELLGNEALKPFEVELHYQDIEGSSYQSTHVIDVQEISGRPADSPSSTKVWRELEKLRKAVEKR